MHVFAQVVEVQAQRIQLGQMQFRLFANPDRAIHQADAFVGLAEPQSIRFTTQQRPGSNVVFVREGHMLLLGILAVEEYDLELLPSSVAAAFPLRQGLALLPLRRRLALIFWRRFTFSTSVMTGTITPSQPI